MKRAGPFGHHYQLDIGIKVERNSDKMNKWVNNESGRVGQVNILEERGEKKNVKTAAKGMKMEYVKREV